VETGTDAAALAAGDIEALNEVLDAPSLDAWIERRDRAAASGVLWRIDTGSDGSFLVHLFVDEEPRSELVSYLRDPIEIPRFPIPSGRVLVAGEECFARQHIENIRLGKVVELPRGEFSLIAYRTEYPDDLAERRLRATGSSRQVRAWSLGNALSVACVALTGLGLVTAPVLYLAFDSLAAAAVPVALTAAAWRAQTGFRRRQAYRSAHDLYQRLANDYPSVVLVLKSRSSDAS
jgi:hypothetical protein